MQRRGYFAIGIECGKYESNHAMLMRSAFAYSTAFTFTVGARFKRLRADTTQSWRHKPHFCLNTVDELKEFIPYDCKLVGVELLPESKPLYKFTHPQRCIYVLGAEDGGLSKKMIHACHDFIQIPDLNVCLNVATTGAIVLNDRISKGNEVLTLTNL